MSGLNLIVEKFKPLAQSTGSLFCYFIIFVSLSKNLCFSLDAIANQKNQMPINNELVMQSKNKMISSFRARADADQATTLKYNSLASLCISIMKDNAEIISRAHSNAYAP
jgi:hypothetical protein